MTARRKSKSAASTYRVFVSHATYDKWVARVICEKLDALGVSTFRDDRDISGGDSIPESVRDGIEQSDEIVVLLSPESITRQWVLLEIGMALAFRKRIVPLMFHIPAEQIPSMIDNARGFSLDEFDAYLDDLKQRITGDD